MGGLVFVVPFAVLLAFGVGGADGSMRVLAVATRLTNEREEIP